MDYSDIRLQVNRAQALNEYLLLTSIKSSDPNELIANMTIMNKIFIYGFFPIGFILNLFLVVYNIFNRKPFYKTIPSFGSLIIINLYMMNYIKLAESISLTNYSAITCKVQTFLFHFTTAICVWGAIYLVSDIKLRLNPVSNRFAITFQTFIPTVLSLFFLYSIEFFYVDMIEIHQNATEKYDIITDLIQVIFKL